MALDDLLKGLSVFNQGLREYAINQGVNDVTKQIQELNQQALDEKERLVATTQVANDLALKLGAAGADASLIGQLAGQLAPSAGAQFQAQENMKSQERSQGFQTAERRAAQAFSAEQADKNRAQQLKIAEINLAAKKDVAGSKKSANDTALELKQIKDFRQANKALFEAHDAADQMGAYLQPVNGRIDQAQVAAAMTKLIRASGDTRVSDEDIARAGANQDVRSSIARKLKVNLSGEAIKNDVKFYTALSEVLKTRIKEKLGKNANNHARAFSNIAKYSPEQAVAFRDNLLTNIGQAEEQPGASATFPQVPQDQSGGAPAAPSGWRKHLKRN